VVREGRLPTIPLHPPGLLELPFSGSFGILSDMSKLLEEAIETLRNLPEDEQDAAADVLFSYLSSEEREYHLRLDQAEAVRRTRRNLNTGKTRLATDAEVTSFRQKLHI
jgi:hypothetical protein